MCFTDGDAPEFFRQSMPRARKALRCDDCFGTIAAGELYQRSSGKWDGDFDSFATCARCFFVRALIQWFEVEVEGCHPSDSVPPFGALCETWDQGEYSERLGLVDDEGDGVRMSELPRF